MLWGNDTVHGGDGNDTLAFTDVNANLTLDLAAGRTTYIEGGTTFDDSGNPVGGFAGLIHGHLGRHREPHRRQSATMC